MEKSPREADSHSASQEIPDLLQNPKVHYRVHKSQMNSVHNFPPYFLTIHSNIILLSMPRQSLPFRFSDQNVVCISHNSLRATCSAHLILLDVITLITFREAPHYAVFFSLPSNKYKLHSRRVYENINFAECLLPFWTVFWLPVSSRMGVKLGLAPYDKTTE